MSVPSQKSTLSISTQASKVGSGTFVVASDTWYRYRVPRVSGLSQQMQAVLPLENGSVITAIGAYKYGSFVGLEADIIPRLEGNFGWLLEAALGDVTSVLNARYTASGFISDVTGVNSHVFRFRTTDSAYQPWLAVRRTIPTSGADIGEVGYDCKVGSLRLNVPAGGLLTGRIGIVGRKFFQEDPSAWTYQAAFEGSDSIPQGMRGVLKIAGTSIPSTGVAIDIMNGLTSPQQEMIIGDYAPDDFIALQRGCSIRLVYKWSDANLYRQILNGGTGNLTWSTLPFIAQTAGSVSAFEAEFDSQGNIPGSSPLQPYKMRIFANKVAWQFDQAGVELAGGDLVMLPIVGTVLDTGDGSDYLRIVIENSVANYTWT